VKVCKQNCVFCFVHQMPKGSPKFLYLKDENIRLSFLYGHFSTLSSSNDAEQERIIRERLSPIHVSVHAATGVYREAAGYLAPGADASALIHQALRAHS